MVAFLQLVLLRILLGIYCKFFATGFISGTHFHAYWRWFAICTA
jgi:hypothetical protein